MAISEILRRVFPGTLEEFSQRAGDAMERGEKLFVVTANPEILMCAEEDETVRTLLLNESTAVTPDGISVVKAMRLRGIDAKERVTGVDLAERLLRQAGETGKTVYLLGAKEEVVSALGKKLTKAYPNMKLFCHNGYDGDKDEIFEKEILPAAPDLVLAALGAPAQELLIWRHLGAFSKGVFMGVGGSFDVLSGMKRRAPAFFVKTNTEWLYRILREPSRLKRFYRSNIKFLGRVKREGR